MFGYYGNAAVAFLIFLFVASPPVLSVYGAPSGDPDLAFINGKDVETLKIAFGGAIAGLCLALLSVVVALAFGSARTCCRSCKRSVKPQRKEVCHSRETENTSAPSTVTPSGIDLVFRDRTSVPNSSPKRRKSLGGHAASFTIIEPAAASSFCLSDFPIEPLGEEAAESADVVLKANECLVSPTRRRNVRSPTASFMFQEPLAARSFDYAEPPVPTAEKATTDHILKANAPSLSPTPTRRKFSRTPGSSFIFRNFQEHSAPMSRVASSHLTVMIPQRDSHVSAKQKRFLLSRALTTRELVLRVTTSVLACMIIAGAVLGVLGTTRVVKGTTLAASALSVLEHNTANALGQVSGLQPSNLVEASLFSRVQILASQVHAAFQGRSKDVTSPAINDAVAKLKMSFHLVFILSLVVGVASFGAGAFGDYFVTKSVLCLLVVLSVVGWLLFAVTVLTYPVALRSCSIEHHVTTKLPSDLYPVTLYSSCADPLFPIVAFSSNATTRSTNLDADELQQWLADPSNGKMNQTIRLHLHPSVPYKVSYSQQITAVVKTLNNEQAGLSDFGRGLRQWVGSLPVDTASIRKSLGSVFDQADQKLADIQADIRAGIPSKSFCAGYVEVEPLVIIDWPEIFRDADAYDIYNVTLFERQLKCNPLNLQLDLFRNGHVKDSWQWRLDEGSAQLQEGRRLIRKADDALRQMVLQSGCTCLRTATCVPGAFCSGFQEMYNDAVQQLADGASQLDDGATSLTTAQDLLAILYLFEAQNFSRAVDAISAVVGPRGSFSCSTINTVSHSLLGECLCRSVGQGLVYIVTGSLLLSIGSILSIVSSFLSLTPYQLRRRRRASVTPTTLPALSTGPSPALPETVIHTPCTEISKSPEPVAVSPKLAWVV